MKNCTLATGAVHRQLTNRQSSWRQSAGSDSIQWI